MCRMDSVNTGTCTQTLNTWYYIQPLLTAFCEPLDSYHCMIVLRLCWPLGPFIFVYCFYLNFLIDFSKLLRRLPKSKLSNTPSWFVYYSKACLHWLILLPVHMKSASKLLSRLPWCVLLHRLKRMVLTDLNLGPSLQRTTLVSSPKKSYKKVTRSSDCRWDPTLEHPRQAWRRPAYPDRSFQNKREQECTTNGCKADLAISMFIDVCVDRSVPAETQHCYATLSFLYLCPIGTFKHTAVSYIT